MDEDGLPTLFLDTRPDFRFQFHLRCYEKKKKNTELEKTVLWNLSKLLSLFDTVAEFCSIGIFSGLGRPLDLLLFRASH